MNPYIFAHRVLNLSEVVSPCGSVHHPRVQENGTSEDAPWASLCFRELFQKFLDSRCHANALWHTKLTYWSLTTKYTMGKWRGLIKFGRQRSDKLRKIAHWNIQEGTLTQIQRIELTQGSFEAGLALDRPKHHRSAWNLSLGQRTTSTAADQPHAPK